MARRAAGRHRSRSGHAQLDLGNSTTFPVHLDFLATDRYGLENLNNLDKIPPRGALAYVGLIPWEEGWRSQPRDRELVAAWALWLSAAPRKQRHGRLHSLDLAAAGCTRLVPADDLKPSSGTGCLVASASSRQASVAGWQRGSSAVRPVGGVRRRGRGVCRRLERERHGSVERGSSPAAQECGGNGTTTSGSTP